MRSKKPQAEKLDSDGLLFPIAPDTPERSAPDESPSPEKPAPEELLLPSHEEAKTLYTLAAQIKALAPWQWMEETDVFGVEDPNTAEIGFVSVMGNIGEHEAVGVYLGVEGIYGFIDLQCDPSATADRLLEIPQVQLSFSEPKFLEKRDRELLKGSGLKFSGAKPQFRSYRPGFLPWFITLKEARLVIHVLAQALDVTKRFGAQLVDFPHDGDGETEPFLVRVSRGAETSRREVSERGGPSSSEGTSTGIVWEDQIQRITRPDPRPITVSIDGSLLRKLKKLPLSTVQLEADLFIGPARIGRPHERPMALYMLMLVDRISRTILGFEALGADPSLDSMYTSVPGKIMEQLAGNKLLPKQIIVRSELLFNLLEPLATEFKIQLRHADNLPAIDEAAASMTRFLQTGKL
ncbi:MAG TPA: hypothetical protein VJU86_04185 [Pyrinomonadaceae bacterium]|nr:hypothetical protein [Pyrinomonadaceae bacterium]